jgi:hypothetical protein
MGVFESEVEKKKNVPSNFFECSVSIVINVSCCVIYALVYQSGVFDSS